MITDTDFIMETKSNSVFITVQNRQNHPLKGSIFTNLVSHLANYGHMASILSMF